jgi:alkylation response protein AidB-like acyl-CoA dehydrogenase
MGAVDAQHLESLLSAVHALEPLIREHAAEAERNRRLSQPVVSALVEAGLFRMYTPQVLGGFEVTPLTFYRVVEEVARIDGSTGWCLMIGGGGRSWERTSPIKPAKKFSAVILA